MQRHFLAAIAVTCLIQTPRAWSDDDVTPRKRAANPRPSELLATLQETVDRDELSEADESLPDALKRLDRILARRGKSLPILLNQGAFKEEAPEAEDLRDTQVRRPRQPAHPTIRQVLQEYSSQVKGAPAGFVVGPGYFELTTEYRATMPRLSTPVTLSVRNRPLALVLDDLFEQTGVSIVVDSRLSHRAQKPITATIADPVPLRHALFVVLNMADLHLVTVGTVVYVTSPQNAYYIFWEQNAKRHFMLDPRSPEL